MTNTRLIGAMRLLCSIAVVAVAAAGCSSGSPDTPAPAGAAGATSGNADSAAVVWREFVSCARQNGEQNMPDPVVNADGTAQFPAAQGFNEKDAYQAVRQPCGQLLDRLPAQANPLSAPSVTPEQMQVLRRYVQCMRDNGVPSMADPGPNGEIGDPPGYGPDSANRAARDAARSKCDRIIRDEFR
jgi:hypothetical protein